MDESTTSPARWGEAKHRTNLRASSPTAIGPVPMGIEKQRFCSTSLWGDARADLGWVSI
jgi:hypothetical protein